MDVVPVEKDRWTVDPFGGVLQNGYLYGRGALDDKSMGIIEMMTLLALKREHLKFRAEEKSHPAHWHKREGRLIVTWDGKKEELLRRVAKALGLPEEIYDIAALLRDNQRFVVESIYSRNNGDVAASVSTTRLHNIAGKYTGKDDPVMLVRVTVAKALLIKKVPLAEPRSSCR
jgi:hypothetical protein